MKTSGSRALGVLAASASLATLLPGAALASTTTRTPASAWAAYTAAPAWLAGTDNVQWYVSSQTVTKGMVGKTLTITATSPATIDCANLGSGYDNGSHWVAVTPLATSTCTATKAVEQFRVTKDLVGHVLYLNGWSAVGTSTTTTIDGIARVGGTAKHVSSTAVYTPPAAQMKLLGTWNGQNVYLSSAGGVNQVVVGDGAAATRYATLDGELWHVGLANGQVDVWTLAGEAPAITLTGWHLDLAGKTVTNQTVTSRLAPLVGTPGFAVMDTLQPYDTSIYAWGGKRVATFDVHHWVIGFTDHAVLIGGSGGLSPANWVTFYAVDGGPQGTVNLPFFNYGGQASWVVDATGATATVAATGQKCRVEPGWTTAQCA